MSAVPQRSASADEVYEKLKAMAIAFEFAPGVRINEVELARTLEVSRTPLREALNRLQSEGFFTRAAGKGFMARHFDAKEVYDIYEMRRILEGGAVRLACERASDEQLEELARFVRESREVPHDSDAMELLGLDEAFHERLALMTGNEEYRRCLININGRIRFFRWVDMQNGRRHYTQNEHLAIVQALMRRDADEAARLTEAHITRRMDQIIEVIRRGVAEIYLRNNFAGER